MLSVPKKIPTRARNIYKVTKTVFFCPSRKRPQDSSSTHSLQLGFIWSYVPTTDWTQLAKSKTGKIWRKDIDS
jgi:hypothetical protein